MSRYVLELFGKIMGFGQDPMENIKFTHNKIISDALTFDDVLLVPAFSEVLPREVDVRTQLTTDISINAPIISAAMDTVTESDLAIAIARQGGVGVIHKNMSIEAQADHVHAKIADALELMKQYRIGGIPVTDSSDKLIGILTNRDLRFEINTERPVQEIMTKDNLITAEKGTDLAKAKSILQEHKIEKPPVVDNDNKLIGLITFKDILKVKNYPSSCKDEFGRLRVGAAIGVSADMYDRVAALIEVGVDFICVDTAHGHSKGVLNTVKELKQKYPDLQVVGGNVATGAGAKALVDVGVNAVKVGAGPGSICTTRIVAGVGVPQLTAINDVAIASKWNLEFQS
ncbi:unnamed protein product [Bathycoccus prasinos]